jgi:predicted nucleic-acid-binding protein
MTAMLSLDTNILARYLLNDTRAQSIAAEELLLHQECTAPVTVFLERVWVLESNGYKRNEITGALRLICALENFTVQSPEVMDLALSWYEQKMDFADSLHLALSTQADRFVTFDKSFVKVAQRMTTVPQVTFP